MIVEIALCVGAGALAVVAGLLVPLLIQLRKPVAESEYLLARMNAELPLLLKEMRTTTENLNMLVEHARGGVEHAAVLLHAAGDWATLCNGPMRRYRARADRSCSTWSA